MRSAPSMTPLGAWPVRWRGLDRFLAPGSTVTLAGYFAVGTLGLIVRLMTLDGYIGHVDEPASLLAIQRTGELGYPLYPSNVLYLQGALFSYLAAPLTWIFHGTELLHAARIVHLCLAMSLVLFTMRLVQLISGSLAATVFTGTLVACDPQLAVWSVTIRPYALLATEVVALVLLAVLLLRNGPEARLLGGKVVYWIPIIVAAGTFTHIAFWLTIPPLALSAVVVWGRALLGSHRAVLISGLVSLVPLLAFLLLGRSVGIGSGTGGDLGNAFVGSHLFSWQRLVEEPDVHWQLWTRNFSRGEFGELLPFLIAITSGVLAHTVLVTLPAASARWRMPAIGTLVLVHWSVVGTVTMLVRLANEPRYLTLVLPIGYVLLGLGVWCLWRVAPCSHAAMSLLVRGAIAAVIVAPTILYVGTAAAWRVDFRGGHPDYWAASAWTAQHMEPGEIAITAMPAATYFWFSEDQQDGLFFLAGPARTEHYVKTDASGEPGDYWLGVPPIGSVPELCGTLAAYPNAGWVIVDAGRLNAGWAFRGPFRTVIVGATEAQFRGANKVTARSILPFGAWSPEARATCVVLRGPDRRLPI